MKIIPYVQIDGAWSLPDSVMAGLWYRMLEEKTAEIVFPTRSVNSLPSFMALVKNPQNCVMTQWIEDEPAFLGWINNFTKCSAFAHFTCFKTIWGKRSAEALSAAFKFWFEFHNDDGPLLETLIGMISADNTRAINLTKRCGVTGLGVIPNYAVNDYTKQKTGLYVCYIERGEV